MKLVLSSGFVFTIIEPADVTNGNLGAKKLRVDTRTKNTGAEVMAFLMEERHRRRKELLSLLFLVENVRSRQQ